MKIESAEASGLIEISDSGIRQAIRDVRTMSQFQEADPKTQRQLVYGQLALKRAFVLEFRGTDQLEDILARAKTRVNGRALDKPT